MNRDGKMRLTAFCHPPGFWRMPGAAVLHRSKV